jgi:hypothetical protein
MHARKNPYPVSVLVCFVVVLLLAGCRQPAREPSREQAATDVKAVVLVDNQDKRTVDIYIDGEVFTSYIYPADLEKPVLFPVKTALGTTITRGFPLAPREGDRVDHPHQVGIWFAYGDVNGYDFWGNSYAIPPEEKQQKGWILHRGVKRAESRDNKGVLELAMDWQVRPAENTDPVTLLQENTTYEFSGTGNIRQIDRITRLTAQQETVLLKDNKEGMYAIRLDRAFEYPSEEPLVLIDARGLPSEVKVLDNEVVSGNYRSSEGVEGLDVWGKRAGWVRLNGVIGEEKITIAFFDHRANPGHPACWHARGYGLFSVNNLGLGYFTEGKEELNFQLIIGESVTFRHRIYITSGYWASDEELNRVYQDFIQEP